MTGDTCVITGAGIISPLGRGLAATRQALARGQSGIVAISRFDTAGFPVGCAGEVPEPNLDAPIPRDHRRPEALARIALEEALATAGLAPDSAPDPRRALSFALGKPTLDLELLARQRSRWARTSRISRISPPMSPPEPARTPAEVLQALPELQRQREQADAAAVLPRLAARAGAGGERYSSYTACASGNDAIGLGKRLIERGHADVVIAGASDCQVHPLSLLEFELLSALSHEPAATACRPFDRQRTGFVVGEGAAVLVLEAAAHAQRRHAPVLAHLAGYGSSLDSYGLTKCHPQGRGAALAMAAALADAGLDPSAIGYINAHGTGTVLNDAAEAAAITHIWGAAAQVPVSSTKSATGHLLTAASAVEAVFTLLCLQDHLLPANLNFRHSDPDCTLNIVAAPTPAPALLAAMSNGFGFGGQNACLILRRAA
ncbi:MAG TPA: beta-ketoacyl-[acyl-carrier-protein] synthase family protein [Terriglobales bacterium]|jgi:3-oxoacyl-[acyl-carrier-protein] synthase II